jgi:hypothetical protein
MSCTPRSERIRHALTACGRVADRIVVSVCATDPGGGLDGLHVHIGPDRRPSASPTRCATTDARGATRPAAAPDPQYDGIRARWRGEGAAWHGQAERQGPAAATRSLGHQTLGRRPLQEYIGGDERASGQQPSHQRRRPCVGRTGHDPEGSPRPVHIGQVGLHDGHRPPGKRRAQPLGPSRVQFHRQDTRAGVEQRPRQRPATRSQVEDQLPTPHRCRLDDPASPGLIERMPTPRAPRPSRSMCPFGHGGPSRNTSCREGRGHHRPSHAISGRAQRQTDRPLDASAANRRAWTVDVIHHPPHRS